MRKKLLFPFFFIALIFNLSFFSVKSYAEDDSLVVVAVGEATLEKDKMVIQEPYFQGTFSSLEKNVGNDFVKLLRNDFSFYQKKFYLLEAAPNNTPIRPPTNFDYWAQKGTRYLGTVELTKTGDGLKLIIIVEDIKSKKMVYTSSILTSVLNLRKNGHETSNAIYKQLVGKDSIFKSKIVFVSDRNSKIPKTVKEVYLMDFDGKNVNQLTSHGGIAISPSISSDGARLVYSLISNINGKRSNNLYLMDLKTKETHTISSREGINSGAVFLTGGKSIALTLTVSGNAEIYEMDLETKSLRRITNHFSSDVDPSLTYDGKLMAFLSDRSGKAMIYTMDPTAEEKNVKRISFVGKFNATPRFSPDGKEIVFASWLDNVFDIFRVGSDGQNLTRLTKNFGSNEDPSFSPDGEFVAFSSQRIISRVKADQNIYIMDKDGEILGAITQSFGNCTSPRWYNF